jgi:hypothetical protein
MSKVRSGRVPSGTAVAPRKEKAFFRRLYGRDKRVQVSFRTDVATAERLGRIALAENRPVGNLIENYLLRMVAETGAGAETTA